ncbi:MAG: hypothetical protein M9904_08845 [Chitinophagaceae bacterium]|nr:hypothetical protein [Chitinophagaceae bacterium]
MDTRATLNSRASFLSILSALHTGNTKASLLYDNNGLTRYEGLIVGINGTLHPVLLLEDGLEIPVSSVIAVNGIFIPDYSEC